MKTILSTLPYIPGYRIQEVLGIIYARDSSFQVHRHIWNFKESLERAYKELEKKALSIGANAVLACNIAYDANTQIPIVQGTAVVLDKESEN